MALQVWLPFLGNKNNYGLDNITTSVIGDATWDSAGKLGKCFNSHGNGQGVEIANYMPTLKTYTNYTMCAWIKIETGASAHSASIMSSGNWNTSNGCLVFGLYNNDVSSGATYYKYLIIPNTGTWDGFITIPNYLYVGTWYHVAITYDGSKTYAYINGELIGTSSRGGICQNSNTNVLKIGAATYYNGFTLLGKINDARIYDECLSDAQIKEISKGLILHYKFDDPYIESTTNLITGIGSTKNCTKDSSNNVYIDWASTGVADTYMFFTTSSALSTSKTYSFSFMCEGLTDADDGTTFNWANRSGYVIRIKNGLNKLENFTPPVTDVFIDDTTRASTTMKCRFYNFQLEEKSHCTPFAGYGSTRTATVLSDCSGYGYDGTPKANTLTISSDSSRYNISTYITGSTNRVLSTCPTNVGHDNFTLAIWVKIPTITANTWQLIFGSKGASTASSGIGLYYRSTTKKLCCSIADGSTGQDLYTSDIIDLYDAWHHIAMIRDSSYSNKVLFYVDGVKKDVTSAASIINVTGIQNLAIGDNPNTYYPINMYVNDARFYRTALSENDIKELYRTSAKIDNKGNLLTYEFIEEE